MFNLRPTPEQLDYYRREDIKIPDPTTPDQNDFYKTTPYSFYNVGQMASKKPITDYFVPTDMDSVFSKSDTLKNRLKKYAKKQKPSKTTFSFSLQTQQETEDKNKFGEILGVFEFFKGPTKFANFNLDTASDSDIEECFQFFIDNKNILDDIKNNFLSAATAGINWSTYFPHDNQWTSLEVVNYLIERDPQAMQSYYQYVVTLETAKFQHIAAKFKGQGGNKICEQLIAFRKLINEMEINNHDKDVVASFKAIVTQIEKELIGNTACDLSKTVHPVVLTEFTHLAKRLIKNPQLTQEEIDDFDTNLAKKIKKLTPMSPKLKTTIGLAIGVLIGAAIGFAIGAAVTFWGAGFGGIGGAILGATLAQGLILGGAAAGGAAVVAIPAAISGHRHAKNKHTLFQEVNRKMPDNALDQVKANALTALTPKVEMK